MNKLENLKVGDLVVVKGNITDIKTLSKIDRVTKTQIIIGYRRFRKSDGQLVGRDDWHYANIRPATDEDIERINKDREKRELVKHLNGVVWYNLPLESLTHIWDVVKKEIGNIAAKQ